MNMRILTAATVVLASFAAVASAADVSKSTLNGMGFGNMQQISDTDGLAIRGKGTSASVWGESTANYRGQTSTNGYAAIASHSHSPSSAQGKNLSFAGKVKIEYNQVNGLSARANLGVGGGFSSASAH
jgi:hypothetical protein